jgi:hypothetical protein
MITPAYSPTATERVLPRMALDFTTGALDPRVTITRALNTATAINSSGFIAVVNANLPRFDYNPVTLAPRGLLIEEARTNLLTYSEDFSNAVWFKSAGSVTTDVTTSPDGTVDADTFIEDTSTGTHIIRFQPFTLTSGVTYTSALYVKANGRNRVRLINFDGVSSIVSIYDLSAGTVVSGTGSIVSMGNGWYRVIQTFTAVSTLATNFAYQISLDNGTTNNYPGNGTSGVFIWGAQLEAGAFATSYIPTVASTVTRNADVVTMTGTNFSSWYNASEGALMTEASTFSNASTDKFVANINNNGFPNRILMNFSSLNNFSASVVSNSATQVSGTNGVAAALNTPIKMCFAFKLDNFAFSQSGVAPTTDNLGAMPVTVDRLWIGSATTTAFLNGHMLQIKYWPQRLINAETQAFSK